MKSFVVLTGVLALFVASESPVLAGSFELGGGVQAAQVDEGQEFYSHEYVLADASFCTTFRGNERRHEPGCNFLLNWECERIAKAAAERLREIEPSLNISHQNRLSLNWDFKRQTGTRRASYTDMRGRTQTDNYRYWQDKCELDLLMVSRTHKVIREVWEVKGRADVCDPAIQQRESDRFVIFHRYTKHEARSRMDAPSSCSGVALKIVERK